MNEQQQRIAIAEVCGYSFDTEPDSMGNYWLHKEPGIIGGDCQPNIKETLLHLLPDYLHDLNAIHEAEKMLTKEQSVKWLNFLSVKANQGEIDNSMLNLTFNLARATAPQRAEAFLRTVGKWKDDDK